MVTSSAPIQWQVAAPGPPGIPLHGLERAEVHAVRNVPLAFPPYTSRRCIRRDSATLVVANEIRDRARRKAWRLPPAIEVLRTARIIEHRPSSSPPADAPAALVHEPMMKRTQQQTIGETGLAAVRPVHQMVCVGKTQVAPRKAAATVPNLQRAPQSVRDRACLPSYLEDRAVVRVSHINDARITRQPATRFS